MITVSLCGSTLRYNNQVLRASHATADDAWEMYRLAIGSKRLLINGKLQHETKYR